MEQIAIYLRLSKEDEFVKDESNSITNQRAFIRGFINKNKELRKVSVMEFVDDGYSGKNMDRPDMQRMLELVKRKQISCVIVKDFSRFSRDHIEQGKYIEQIFPFMGVRFIAINDNYDSADYVGGIGEIDVAFKGILYDFFSEEQSSKEDFEKVAAMRKENTCASVKRKHETHCLTGKMICGNCGHRLSHTYAGRPKYYCANHYLDKTDEKCNISVLDADMESVVKKALQMMIDAQVDSRKVVDMQREKQAERLKQAEKHLSDMEYSRELIEKDLREAYESYKLGMTDKETYLEQRKTYEQMLERLQENIEKQRAAVTKMADVDVPEVAGLEMLEGQLKLTGLNREMVDVFVEKIVVYAQDRVEIKWKFKDEFGEVGKVEKDRIFGGEYGNGVV